MPKILVADDSIAVRKVAERLLTEAGLGVTLAANGEEALAYLSKERPDVIVSDVIMPDKSGYEVCAFVRSHASLAATPVLLISGIVNDEVTKQAESCHADGVLKKPFQGTSLKDRVLELLAKRQEPAVAPSASMPIPAPGASGEVWNGPRITDEQLAVYKQAVDRASEFDAQERAEKAAAEGFKKKIMELEVVAAQAKELESQLAAERQRVEEASIQSNRASALEAQVHAERAAAEGLKERIEELEVVAAQAKELESELAVERQRVEEAGIQASRTQAIEAELTQERQRVGSLSARIASHEEQLSEARAKTSTLESALKSAQDSIQGLRQQVADLDHVASTVPQLESRLTAERASTEKLTQQVTVLEAAVERAKDLEERLSREERRAADCERQTRQAETMMTAEQTRVVELSGRLAEAERGVQRLTDLESRLAEAIQVGGAKENRIHELEQMVAAAQEVTQLLEAERNRNAVLARRVSESEQSAEQSMQRFEDMARKLGEIAGLASQLGSGKGRA